MAIKNKHYWIAGVLTLSVSIAAGAAYLQYQRMMNYVIKLKGVKFIKLATNLINFDIILNFTNKSDLSIKIISMLTKVYVNDKHLVDIQDSKSFELIANATSPMTINIKLDPKSVSNIIGANYLKLISNPQDIVIRADIKLKAKLWFFKVNIPYTYQATLKELMTPAPVASDK